MGYHSDSQQQQPLAITYPSPTSAALPSVDFEKDTPNISKQKRKYRRRIKTEPQEIEQIEPKIESISDIDDSILKSPAETFEPCFEIKVERKDGVEFQSPEEKPIKKKVKVMLPSLDSPRGLRTLLPGMMNLFIFLVSSDDNNNRCLIKTREQRTTSDSSETDTSARLESTNTFTIESRQHKSKKLAKRCGRGGRGVAGQFWRTRRTELAGYPGTDTGRVWTDQRTLSRTATAAQRQDRLESVTWAFASQTAAQS